jgi:ABC-type transport system substrate-binding protein
LDPNDGFQSNYGPAKGGDNLVRFDLPEFNQLFERQGQMANGPERLALLMKMRDIVNAYEPAKFTWNPVGIYLNYPWVKGYRRDPLIADWWKYVDIDETAQASHLQRSN